MTMLNRTAPGYGTPEYEGYVLARSMPNVSDIISRDRFTAETTRTRARKGKGKGKGKRTENALLRMSKGAEF